MSPSPAFIIANYVEACLWIAFAIVAIVKRTGPASWVLAITLLLFGISDLVESRTGAWYRPWWLLVWKAACVVALVVLGVREIRAMRAARRSIP